MADVDLSALSDEELAAIIAGKDVTQAPPGQGAAVQQARNVAVEEKLTRAPKPRAEEIEPSAFKRGAAAAGGALMEPIYGAAEKFELAFPGKGREDETIKRIGQERAERRGVQRELEETTAGQFGSFVGKAAPFAVAGPTPMGQAVMAGALGFLAGGPDAPKGLGNELATSTFQGGVEGAATGAMMKGAQLAHKGVMGAAGKFTPDGETAMGLETSAQRLGLPRTTIGQLDPLAPEALRANPELAIQQAQTLQQRMAGTRQVPAPAGGMEEQVVPGGRLKQGMEEAIATRRKQARDMYTAVDDLVSQNNLGNVTPNYTVNVLSSANKLTPSGKQPTGNNIVYNLLDTYDPDAFAWLKQAGTPKNAKAQGMSMTQYHDSRVAVGRALNSLDRKNPADLTSDQIEAKKILVELKNALDNDVERWAKLNSGNQEAMDMYNRAKQFYAEVAAPAINNPLARKTTSVTRGWNSPESMYASLINPLNRSLVERLLPTASRETSDVLNVLQNLPDVGAVAARGTVPTGGASRELGALVRGAAGHPGLALMEMAPGLRWLSSTTPAKRAYFGREPGSAAGMVYGPAAQYPAGALETWAQERTSTGRGR